MIQESAIAAGFSALLITAGHWFPWRKLLHRDLHRVEAYTYGVLAILAPAFFVLAHWGGWDAINLISICTIAAGVTTVLTKGIDLIAEWRNELKDRRNNDA